MQYDELPMTLADLIRRASTELGSDACAGGRHDWHSVGGRGCPHPEDIGADANCSQAVYECRTCGQTDYGYSGGPGHEDCMGCRDKWRATDQGWWSTSNTPN
jgi:hypothetical protein